MQAEFVNQKADEIRNALSIRDWSVEIEYADDSDGGATIVVTETLARGRKQQVCDVRVTRNSDDKNGVIAELHVRRAAGTVESAIRSVGSVEIV